MPERLIVKFRSFGAVGDNGFTCDVIADSPEDAAKHWLRRVISNFDYVESGYLRVRIFDRFNREETAFMVSGKLDIKCEVARG